MWETPQGERVLVGAEAELIRSAIASMVDRLHQEANGLAEECPCGVERFDAVSWRKRLALLDSVAKALFREDVPAPRRAAVKEATVGAIFACIGRNLENEIAQAKLYGQAPGHDSTYWRRRVAACQEQGDVPVSEKSTDMKEWDVLLECNPLHEPDGLWSYPDYFADPDVWTACDFSMVGGGLKRELVRLHNEYFKAPVPDPRDDELEGLFSDLHRLTEGR